MGEILIATLVMVGLFFLGRLDGILTEAKYWKRAAENREPMLRDGVIYEVKALGGE